MTAATIGSAADGTSSARAKYLVQPARANSGLIKGAALAEYEPGAVPAFSASGQDVWVRSPVQSEQRPGLVLSAVGARCGKVFRADETPWTTVANTVAFVPRPGVDVRYAGWILDREDFWIKGGAAQPYVQIEPSLQQPIHLPGVGEQRRIADYLEDEVGRIEALIGLARRQERLVAERLAGELTEITAPAEDDAVVALKRITTKIGSGKTPTGGSEIYVAEGVVFLRSQNVHRGRLALDDVAFISPEVDREMSSTRVRAGDVLLNITGASIGRSAPVPDGMPAANVNQHVCIVRLQDPSLAEWVSSCLNSQRIIDEIDLSQLGGNRDGLNFEQVRRLTVTIPRDLDRRMGRLADARGRADRALDRLGRLVRLLGERRQAVVDAAVTGRIDVSTASRSVA